MNKSPLDFLSVFLYRTKENALKTKQKQTNKKKPAAATILGGKLIY